MNDVTCNYKGGDVPAADHLREHIADIRAHGYPFPVVRAVLRAHDLPTGQGWEPQVEKLVNLAEEEGESALKVVRRLHRSLALYSEKALQLFEVAPMEAGLLASAIGVYTPGNKFSSAFPFSLSEQLLQGSRGALNVASVISDETGGEFDEDGDSLFFDSLTFAPRTIPSVVLSGKRYKTLRSEFDVSQLAGVPSSLQSYDQIVAIRRIALQFNHVIAVHALHGRAFVEVRLDSCVPWLAGELEKHFLFVRDWVNRFYKERVDKSKLLLTGALNLFPSIAALYAAPCGRVRQAGSSAPSASVREEKMRRLALDLRVDPFHSSGVVASGAFNGHSVQKNWDSNVYETTPSLVLPGTISIASATSPYLGHGFIHGAACQDDYFIALEQLLLTV